MNSSFASCTCSLLWSCSLQCLQGLALPCAQQSLPARFVVAGGCSLALIVWDVRSNAIILRETLPAYCIPTVVRLKTGEVLYEKAYMSPRPPPEISLRHDWAKGEVPLGSTVDQQPEGEVVRQSQEEVARRAKFFQPTQPIPKPICDRSGQPDNTQGVFVVKGEMSRSQEIDVKSFHEELCSSDRSGNLISRKT